MTLQLVCCFDDLLKAFDLIAVFSDGGNNVYYCLCYRDVAEV